MRKRELEMKKEKYKQGGHVVWRKSSKKIKTRWEEWGWGYVCGEKKKKKKHVRMQGKKGKRIKNHNW